MLTSKIYKEGIDWGEYSKLADWCNENKATLVDKGEYYEVCEAPKLTLAELTDIKKEEIKDLLNGVSYKTEKFVDGAISDEEYAPIRLQKQKWREAYNAVEKAATLEELNSIVY